LQRQDLVSVTRFVCGNPRSANQTSNTFRPHWQKPPWHVVSLPMLHTYGLRPCVISRGKVG
jgi:hypothetical protein